MEQIYYASGPVDSGTGAETSRGYQVKRRTPGYPPSADLRSLAFEPYLPGTTTLAPGTLRYHRDGDAAELVWLNPAAPKSATPAGSPARPGTCFAHGLRLDVEELSALANWPAGLFDRPFWCRRDPDSSVDQPPRPLAIGRGDLMIPPTFGAVHKKLARGGNLVRLARLLTTLAEAARTGRCLFLIDTPERIVRRVALLTFAFPEAMRPALTFSTYHSAPESLSGFRLQGTIPEARPDHKAMLGQGIVADLSAGTFEPHVDSAFWAMSLAQGLIEGGERDRAVWTTFDRLAGEGLATTSAEDVWSDDRLEEIMEAALADPDGPSAREPRAEASRAGPGSGEGSRKSASGIAIPGPSESQVRALAGPAVGIDLGTTYSVVASLDRQGRPATIPNAVGDILTPSVVLFEDDGVVVGKAAVAASARDPDRVAECVKRDMGARAYHKSINGQAMPPEVISSMILRKLKSDAERKVGLIARAVITVPAYFDELRRRATADAGRLAGIEVLDIINEPTAAALAYAHHLGLMNARGTMRDPRPFKALVYDLGGGTFDVTVVELKGGSFRAIATDGDVFLGGKDWDEQLVELAARRFLEARGTDPRDDPQTLQVLILGVEVLKRTLSERAKASLEINHRGNRLTVEITREEFEEATAALLERTRTTAEIVVLQAGLSWSEIDRVLLVGGSTRMPMVARMLEDLTGKPPDASLSADEAVAQGAALYAGLLLRNARPGLPPADFTVTDVNSHSLGLVGIEPETKRRTNQVLIPKNTPLPHSVSRRFKTMKPGQQSVKITVLEGESEVPDACTQVGTCVIRNLPPELPRGSPVEVIYTYQSNGRLQIVAKLLGHESAIKTEFARMNDLSTDAFAFWVESLASRSNRAKA